MINRGEVWKVDLDPAKGTEIKKKRSCVVISANHLNKWGHRFIVVPLTSKKGKVLCDQIRTVDRSRLIKTKQGKLTNAEMDAIEEKLLATFDLWEYLKKRGTSIKAPKIIAILSQKGGGGKSTLARALAAELTKQKQNTLLVDLDIQQKTSQEWAERLKQQSIKPLINCQYFPYFPAELLKANCDYI